jgi:hypothetical protein
MFPRLEPPFRGTPELRVNHEGVASNVGRHHLDSRRVFWAIAFTITLLGLFPFHEVRLVVQRLLWARSLSRETTRFEWMMATSYKKNGAPGEPKILKFRDDDQIEHAAIIQSAREPLMVQHEGPYWALIAVTEGSDHLEPVCHDGYPFVLTEEAPT